MSTTIQSTSSAWGAPDRFSNARLASAPVSELGALRNAVDGARSGFPKELGMEKLNKIKDSAKLINDLKNHPNEDVRNAASNLPGGGIENALAQLSQNLADADNRNGLPKTAEIAKTMRQDLEY